MLGSKTFNKYRSKFTDNFKNNHIKKDIFKARKSPFGRKPKYLKSIIENVVLKNTLLKNIL